MALETKLIVGRYIAHPSTGYNFVVATQQPFAQNLFLYQQSNISSIRESTTLSWKHPFTRTSAIETQERTEINKQHRNFYWLHFAEGQNTYLERSFDVLSGPFSGCWLIAFHYHNQDYVAHIGTTQDHTQSLEVKQSWNTFAALLTGPDYIIGGFNPFRSCQTIFADISRQNTLPVQCWGLITTKNEYYSIVATIDSNRLAKIKAVIPVKSSHLATLRILH